MYVCVYVSACVCECMCVSACVCACVCVCECECMCVSVCVCELYVSVCMRVCEGMHLTNECAYNQCLWGGISLGTRLED